MGKVDLLFNDAQGSPPDTVIYAVERTTGYFYTLPADSAPNGTIFTFSLPQGEYQFYAYSTDLQQDGYYALWQGEAGGLGSLALIPGQHLTGATLLAPRDICNPAYWVPPSPDGRFPGGSQLAVEADCTLSGGTMAAGTLKLVVQTPGFLPLIFYAVDTTGNYYKLEEEQAAPNSEYSLDVPPGSYQVYARSSGNEAGLPFLGAWGTSGGLKQFRVKSEQTVEDIVLRVPEDMCDPLYWLPASPDGLYPPVSDNAGLMECDDRQDTTLSGKIELRVDVPGKLPVSVVIYAVNAAGEYYSLDQEQVVNSDRFTLYVQPGVYQIYARALESDEGVPYFGYWQPGGGLAYVRVMANQKMDGIVLSLPEDACDPVYWLPPTPDDEFPATNDTSVVSACSDSEGAGEPARLDISFSLPEGQPPDTLIYVVAANGEYYTIAALSAPNHSFFFIEVEAGSYQIYARSTQDGSQTFFGLWSSSGGLASFVVNGGQHLTGLVLSPPANPCSASYTLPPSPDGKFPSTSEYCD